MSRPPPIRLGINIDHVATSATRAARASRPLRAAQLAIEAGADGITAHLREDRRHISDADIERDSLTDDAAATQSGNGRHEEMLAIALRIKPHAVLPRARKAPGVDHRRRSQRRRRHKRVRPCRRAAGGRHPGVAVHRAGSGADRGGRARRPGGGAAHRRLLRGGARATARGEPSASHVCARRAAGRGLGLEVHAGHGIDYDTVGAIAAIPEIAELNIGHFLIGEAIFPGLDAAIRRMRALMDAARDEAAA